MPAPFPDRPPLNDERRQMFFGFGISGFWDKERYISGVSFEHLTHALPQHSPHENIGINHQSSTWHSASSRGQTGGSA